MVYDCVPNPSTCFETCGDGLIRGIEVCDDNNTLNGDGCSFICQVEENWQCDSNEPTNCWAILNDGIITGDEECDDGNDFSNDGCDPNGLIEIGW